ncbi:MAG: prepilin-type N-terminal cleavage/methylation domain-containing protein [Deltaproteobacteria bacterium]|nr:prepilin-type N-terminal cleavage/methylation domain-containing protein [Deltaproteobacteria bacterium]
MTHPIHTARRRGFTILEVMVALGILVTAMVVLVDSQSTAVMMTTQSDRIMTATALAQEKMNQALLCMESAGIQEQDIEAEGDFDQGIFGGYEAGGLDGELEKLNEEAFEDFRWAYTVREVKLEISGDVGSLMGDLEGMGLMPGADQEAQQSGSSASGFDPTQNQPDLEDLGISNDMLTEKLSPFMREVRVIVWWGENEDEDQQVELVTHVINPKANVVTGDQGADGPVGVGCDGLR